MFAAGPTVAFGRELVSGLLAGGILYFAPTLVAVARHRGAASLTFGFNLLLGWTGIGWLAAWVLAFTDRRLRIHVTSATPTCAPLPPSSVTLAPDGRHWWDGFEWRDGWRVAPSSALRSPDGSRWFTGTQWIPGAVDIPACGTALGPSAARDDALAELHSWPLWDVNRE